MQNIQGLRGTARALAIVLVVVLLAAASGCVQQASAAPAVCKDCKTGEMAPKVAGTAAMVDGVQEVRINVASGYYAPNAITVAAGKPVRVVFEGTATGCLAKPQFPEFGKSAEMSSGRAVIELDALQPGVYKFTCGMKMNSGTITAE